MGDVINFAEGLGKGRGKVSGDDVAGTEYPQELLDEAAEYIDSEFIKDGGDYREDSKGVYWLDLPHLVEFEKADRRLTDDKEFWEWFQEYRREHKIYSGSKKKQSWRSKWDDKWSSAKYEDRYSSKSSMTSWYSGWGWGSGSGYYSSSAGSELTHKLALGLGAVQSIVDVINNTGKRTRTHLADSDSAENPTSFTILDNPDFFDVVVSPQAMLDTSIPAEEGIEITGGYALHEGSHVEYSSKVIDEVTKPSVLRPLVLAGYLFNILEDIKIEHKTTQKFPGFGSYFDKALAYLWDKTKDLIPTVWGPELQQKQNAITASVKWTEEYSEYVEASTDDRLKEEYAWFTNWAVEYRDTDKPLRQSIIEALAHLAEDPETAKQMADQAKQEEEYEKSSGQNPGGRLDDNQFRDLMRQLRDQFGQGGKVIDGCPSPGFGMSKQPVKLTPDQAEQVQQLLREELRHDEVGVAPNEDTSGRQQKLPKNIVTRPEEDQWSRSAYKKPGPILNRLKSAFQFRKTAPEYADRDQRSGYLDEDAIWKVLGNDTRVFERKHTQEITNTQVTMLVDLSGSMQGHNVNIAMEMATVMLECLRNMKGVRVRVRGHNEIGDTQIFRIWEQGDPMTRLGLLKRLIDGGTPDGFALDWASQELLSEQRPGEEMVLIMLSDGEPNWATGGMTGQEYVRKVTNHYEKKGIYTIQIAIDSAIDAHSQAEMYKHWIEFKSADALPGQLTKLLIRLFGGVSQ